MPGYRWAGLVVDQLILWKIKQAMGGRVRFIVSGGAALAPHVEDFCNVALAPLLQVTCPRHRLQCQLDSGKGAHGCGDVSPSTYPHLRTNCTVDLPAISWYGPQCLSLHHPYPSLAGPAFDIPLPGPLLLHLQGYGLTETCAASFIMLPNRPRMSYSVGPPLSATEFRFESVPELKYDATANPPKVSSVMPWWSPTQSLLLRVKLACLAGKCCAIIRCCLRYVHT